MAGKGGGAWKVAYADFVTAMMAFFLVMWLCSQDQQVRTAVARYFNNPLGFETIGSSKKPDGTGSIFDSPNWGEVPKHEGVALGRGRHSHTRGRESGPATKLMGDWLAEDKEASTHWKEQAERFKQQISADPKDKKRYSEEMQALTRQLARKMREEVTKDIPKENKGIYQDFIYRAMSEVNWTELAEDLMTPDGR